MSSRFGGGARRRLAVLAAVVAASAFSACGSPQGSVEAARPVDAAAVDVRAVTAAVGEVVATLAVSGSLVPQTRVAVGSKLPGRLDRVFVDIGDRVGVGQVMATLDAREIDAQVDAAAAAVAVGRASVEAADAALSNASLELDRARNLFSRGALPRQRLEATETAHRAAAAQRDLAAANQAQAEAALRRAREVRRDATLHSPIAGIVVERHFDAGNLVSPGDRPVVVVADTRVLKLEAGVGELEAGRLDVGMRAVISVQARPGATYEGFLAAIAPEIDARNRHFQVEVRMQNPGLQLLSGMYATARIQTARARDTVLVPREAIHGRDRTAVVLRIEAGRVEPVPVTLGIADDARVQVLSGVSAGTVIVADARKLLAAGTKVRAILD